MYVLYHKICMILRVSGKIVTRLVVIKQLKILLNMLLVYMVTIILHLYGKTILTVCIIRMKMMVGKISLGHIKFSR